MVTEIVDPLGRLIIPDGGFAVEKLSSDDFNPAKLQAGHIYELDCVAGDKNVSLGLPSDLTEEEQAIIDEATGATEGSIPSLGGFVLVTDNCNLVFDDSVNYKNAVFAAAGAGTGRDAIQGSSYVQLGNMDSTTSCDTDPVVIISGSGASFAGGMSSRNAQFIVDGNLNLAAPGNDDSVFTQDGSNFWVNGNAYLAAGHSFQSCADRSDGVFMQPYFARLVL